MDTKFIQYLKQNKGFKRLLGEMYEKYRSHGTVRGRMVLVQPSAEEREALGGLMQKHYKAEAPLIITASGLQKAINQTPYAGNLLDDIVKAYFGEMILSKREEKERSRGQQDLFFAQFIERFDGTFSGKWLADVYSKNDLMNTYLKKQYAKDEQKLARALDNAMTAGNALPMITDQVKRIAVFAAETAGNPHAFDEGEVGNHILTAIIKAHLGMTAAVENAEAKNELFFKAGILKDDLLNYTTTFGITCRMKDGHEHSGVKGYYGEAEPCLLTLHLLAGAERVMSPKQTVFIVENSGVFAELVEKAGQSGNAFVCTGGQVKLSSLLLLDMFSKQGYEMYYAGDYDPEGLQIAQKLKHRYGDNLKLWRYTLADYEHCLSKVELGSERIRKLRSIDEPQLAEIGGCMQKTGLAGYQEYLIEEYVADIVG